MMPNLYDEARAADAAGLLLHLTGEPLDPARLNSLLYLAERLTLRESGYPLTGDYLLSTPDGMVLERLSRHFEKFRNPTAADRLLGLFQGNIALRSPVTDPEVTFLELNENDRDRITRVWKEFGSCSLSALRETTTTRCNEWLGPQLTKRVQYQDVFPHLGFSPSQASALATRIEARSNLNAAFSK